jgi:UDP-N-acetylmuramoyl-L-alanyl-D-glutamate--2,6-diaminopimelate ligase
MKAGTIKLKALFENFPEVIFKGSKNPEITGLSNNSKAVAHGHLFIAKKGSSYDGSSFIEEAIGSGAAAILSDLYNPFLAKEVSQLIHPDPASLEASLAKIFYDSPDEKLKLIGITGTNGKTTTAYLVHHILENTLGLSGLIGTVETRVGVRTFPSTMTTPDILTAYRLFAEMVSSGCKAASLEVSSHAIDQKRLKGVALDVACFTNLSQDHLDYHKTLEAYLETKCRLFSSEYHLQDGYAVINKDSPHFEKIKQNTKRHVITYAIDRTADLGISQLTLSREGFSCDLYYQGKRDHLSVPLCGRFNVYNTLAAIGSCLAIGLDLDKIVGVLKSFPGVPGRLERIENTHKRTIFVDYAHTEEALRTVLGALKEVTQGRLITVFGCGGNRDALKRPLMGKAVQECSDLAILTNDNPRKEDPQEIARQVLHGVLHPEKILVDLDRASAIEKAIAISDEKDTILIAGKGHERQQVFAHHTTPFDDREEAKKACNKYFS